MKKHILEAQFTEDTAAASDSNGTPLAPFATSLTLEACKCQHLQKWLPHVLDLSCAVVLKDNEQDDEHKETKWIMSNPVHALHMAAHLEPDGATVFLPKEQEHGELALYGEEQCRSQALITKGISPAVELITEQDDTKHEYVTRRIIPSHEPTVVSSQQQVQQQAIKAPSSTTAGAAQRPSVTTSKIQQPPSSSSTAPRRPALPSGIVPPKAPPGTLMAPPPNVNRSSGYMMTSPRSTPATNNKTAARLSNDNNKTTRSSTTTFLLSEERFDELCRNETALLQHTSTASSRRKVSQSAAAARKAKKKQKLNNPATVPLLPNAMFQKTLYQISNLTKWQQDARIARATVEEWMERFRLNRQAYWQEEEQRCVVTTLEFPQGVTDIRECQVCRANPMYSCRAVGDELMQCLECSFIGCGPQSLLEESGQHMMHHMILSGHNFAVTCGERAEVFCFKCGDFVYHSIFDQERERIDISKRLPWMGWHDHPVQRSFDAMQFLNTTEHGVVWRGLIASYPPLVPKELIQAGRLSLRRLLVTRGDFLSPSSLSWGSQALAFAVYQHQKERKDSCLIQAPVGMYNLGNTCFMSCILQCLIHCIPLQRRFLRDVGHHYKSCELIRSAYGQNGSTSTIPSTLTKPVGTEDNKPSICLACEMDKLFLQYFGSSIGRDVNRAVCQAPHPLDRYENSMVTGENYAKNELPTRTLQGDPLVTTELLASAWKSGGMDHLAGYEQGDAHEFLQAFLDTVGKHCGEYRKLIRFMQRMALPSNAKENANVNEQNVDVIKQLFEGTLRSVLICQECGSKRKMPESFLNVSLPLSKHVGTAKMSLQRCLEQFTAPEALADPVDCPSCRKKTATKKQHTFAKLPKVLCLHLKRFDAAKNRKIDDFVSFPSHGLDMGKLLPHWCESGIVKNSLQDNEESSPRVLYDLFATANHTGTLHQGHYIANVKVGSHWFHCNDAHVSHYNESDVLHSEGAYVLFYIRR